MANYIYESGEQVTTGSHGETSYVYASGDPVPNTGKSTLVFESGTGLGGGFILSDSTTGVHSTSYTHTEFWNYQGNESNHGSYTDYHAAGLQNGVSPSWADPANNRNERIIMVGLHYSESLATYALIVWFPGPIGASTQWEVETVFEGLGSHDGTIVLNDGADYGESPDSNATTADGDPAPYWAWTWDPTDGCMIRVDPGTYTVTMRLEDPGNTSYSDAPHTIMSYGPNGVTDEVPFEGYGQEVNITIDV